MVCAPHSTIADVLAFSESRATPLGKKSLKEAIFVGTLTKFIQCIFVTRDQNSSRSDAMFQINVSCDAICWQLARAPNIMY